MKKKSGAGGLPKRRARGALSVQILFTVLAFVAMVTLSYLFMSNIVRDGLIRNVESVQNFAESHVTSDLDKARRELDNFAAFTRERILRGSTKGALVERISALSYYTGLIGESATNVSGFGGYFEALSDGPAYIHSDQFRAFARVDNPGTLSWYTLAVEANGAIVETVPHVNDAGETVFTYAKSILDDEGRRLGVVCVDVRMDQVGQDVVDTALDQGGYGMLVNQDFLILSHPNRDFIGRTIDDPTVPLSTDVAEVLKRGDVVFELSMTSYRGEAAVAFFRQLENGWYLGLVTPRDQYYGGMFSMAAVLCVLGGILAVALIAILIRIDAARKRSVDESRQKSMFLANMSHEIRTPINAIVGMTSIGRAAGTTERKDYCFSKIDNASKHLLGVVNDILDISKIEANKIELSPTDFNFEKMLQQAVNVVNFRVDEKRQKLTVRIDKAIPRILYADDQRLAQVITNLLSNAVKFTPDEGSIQLETDFLGEKDGVCTVKVSVIDDGIGISPEQQKKLFQVFQQAEASTTRKYGGTGLGLAISKSIVEMMGGEIWVESEFGQGTTMAFTVKAKRGEDAYFDLSRHGINWENVRILAVDDDPDVLLYFQEIVSGLGASCEVAKSAGDALRLIDEMDAYNIYFVDLRMPDVDGISLTRAIRSREKTPDNSIVIMISSADLGAVEHEARQAGVNKFLLKPLFPSSITDVISECIGIVNANVERVPFEINGIFAGRRILFAEDIEINREIVTALLGPTGLEIECAENGVEAVRMFNASPNQYDMIFMDVQMPEMDGYEATRQIRALSMPKAKTVPIIAMTANVFKEDIENCLAAGMNGHLGKPFDLEDMIRELYRYLGAGSSAD